MMTDTHRRGGRSLYSTTGLGLFILGLISVGTEVRAAEFSVDSLGLTGSIDSQISIAAGIRMQDRDVNLIGKLNLPGQEQFCEDKPRLPPGSAPGQDCTTVEGNAAFLALPGAPTNNADNGNLNYNKGDVFAAPLRYAPRVHLKHELFSIDLSGIAFYDPVNYNFTEYHPNNFEDNNGFQPRNTQRGKEAERQIGLGFELLDAYLSTHVPLPAGLELSIKLGNQLLSLGTTSTMFLNGLNVVNPPNANRAFRPGADPRDIFERVPLAVFTTSLTDSVSVLGFYQFLWKPLTTPPIGSYFSTSDILGAGTPYTSILFGKNREDPDNRMGVEARTQGNSDILTNAGRTVYIGMPHDPRNSGQFGFNLNYLAGWLNNTSFDFVFLNLHSRLPTVSFNAANEGCTNRSTNQAEALVACEGFTLTTLGTEPLPVDSVRPFLDYVENIQSYGMSFSTNLGEISWTGEVVFRPNQPLQVDPTDVGFAALQPVFPAQSLNFGVVTLPGERVATPDYVETVYRGNKNVQPNSYIRGYERFKTIAYNTSFLFLFGASDNPFGADQVTFLTELGAYQVIGLPSLDQLQIAAVGTYYHHSAGVDGTGTPTASQQAVPANVRLNPHYQEDGFATDFSYGYRMLTQLSYEEVLQGLKVSPQFSFFHDVGGRGPAPVAEFTEGRKQASAGLNFILYNKFSSTIRYAWFFGAGERNPLSDRDNLQFSLTYDF